MSGRHDEKKSKLAGAYEIVIEDLYATREQLNEAIEALEGVLHSVATREAFAAAGKQVNGAQELATEEQSGTLIAAIKAVLRRSDQPMGNVEILKKTKVGRRQVSL